MAEEIFLTNWKDIYLGSDSSEKTQTKIESTEKNGRVSRKACAALVKPLSNNYNCWERERTWALLYLVSGSVFNVSDRKWDACHVLVDAEYDGD